MFLIGMFTGIITETGTVVVRTGSKVSIRASNRLIGKLKRGISVSVDGACLTVVGKKARVFSADIMPETMRRTRLDGMRPDALVNLELPATPAALLSGHFVQGHVDGVGTIKEIQKAGSERILTIAIPRNLTRYVVSKGSIAVNGISLTVIEIRKDYFAVGIIPHTWKTTNLSGLMRGDKVNLEVDVLAKYVEEFV